MSAKRIPSFRKLAWFQYWYDGKEYLAYAEDDGVRIVIKGKGEVFLPWAVIEEIIYWIKWKLEVDLENKRPSEKSKNAKF